MFHGIPQNTQTHPCVPSGTNVDKQFPLGLIGAVCLKPLSGWAFLLLYRDKLPRRKITQAVEKPTGAEWEGKAPHLAESSINVVGLILVSGEPSQKESLPREQQCCFPTPFPYVHFAFFPCNCL